MLREPKEVTVKTQAGEDRTYIISKFDALLGREILTQYPLTNAPKLGSYQASEELMLKLMSCVAVPRDSGEPLALTTKALYTNHVPDWETGAKLEMHMLEYNASFFSNGAIPHFLGGIAQDLRAWLLKTLMDLSGALSQKEKPPFTN